MFQMFQHTAARRRLLFKQSERVARWAVSTHSRPKAAAQLVGKILNGSVVSTHSRPKAAATVIVNVAIDNLVSTHSRPKAAAGHHKSSCRVGKSFNTQPPEGGCAMYINDDVQYMRVSTHSRPKAAATIAIITRRFTLSFNTQPPEGGCRRAVKS